MQPILYLAYKSALIYINIKGWFLIFASIDIGGMFLCIFILDKLMVDEYKHKILN